MDAPHIDFTRPMTFQNALQNFALSLAFVMVALRDEAAFREEPDRASLNAAHLFCSMVEDALADAEAAVERMEKRFSLPSSTARV